VGEREGKREGREETLLDKAMSSGSLQRKERREGRRRGRERGVDETGRCNETKRDLTRAGRERRSVAGSHFRAPMAPPALPPSLPWCIRTDEYTARLQERGSVGHHSPHLGHGLRQGREGGGEGGEEGRGGGQKRIIAGLTTPPN